MYIVIKLIKYYFPKRCDLLVSGGIFANVKLNQRITENCETGSLFVFPAMGDGGIAYGALQLALREKNIVADKLQNLFLGPDFTWDDICLENYNVKSLNLDEKFSESGNPDDLEKEYGFDPEKIAKKFYEQINLAK